MALSIKNDEADALARQVTSITGESLTEAIVVALRERLSRLHRQPGREEQLLGLMAEVSTYPVVDDRPPDEILGYDQFGLTP